MMGILIDKWNLLQAILCDHRLNPTAKIVAARLLDFRNSTTGRCCPSASTLGRQLGLSTRSVIRAIRELETTDWVTINPVSGAANNFAFAALSTPDKNVTPPLTNLSYPPDKNVRGTPDKFVTLTFLKNNLLKEPDARAREEVKTFCEYDYLSKDRAVFFSEGEIEELRQDFSRLTDIRAAIRGADRYFQEQPDPPKPEKRKAAIIALLSNKNQKAGERQIEAARKASAAAERARVEEARPKRRGVIP